MPQGLKPAILAAFFGTTEVVPFQGGIYARGTRDEGLRD